MGFTKYREDIEERHNDDMFLKPSSENWGKKRLMELKKINESTSIKDEFQDIIERIRDIKLWIEYDKNLYGIFTSNIINNQTRDQIKHLNELLDLYIDKFYDTRFDEIKNNLNKQNKVNNTDFKKVINNDYLNYILAYAVNLRNKNYEDMVELRKFYKDLSLFLRIVMSINAEKTTIPLIKFVRETLLDEKEIKVKICERCRKKTYEDFQTCIYCNNDLGEK